VVKVTDKAKEFKSRGFIPMKEEGYYSARIHVVGGRMEASWLDALSGLAAKYGRGQVHLTTRQGVEIPHVKEEDLGPLEEALEKAGLRVGGTGPRVRMIVACPGLDCRHGLVNTQEIAAALINHTAGRLLPNKFKICVAGCPNACPKPIENDLGIQGVSYKSFNEELCRFCKLCLRVCKSPGALSVDNEHLSVNESACLSCGKCVAVCPTGALESIGTGFALWVGGKMGRHPRFAHRLPFDVQHTEDLPATLDTVLDWYCKHGEKAERFGDTINRVGLDGLTSDIRERVRTTSTSGKPHTVGPMCPSPGIS